MSLRESSATALVRFTGLGIVCFNREKARGEVAVIRDDRHTLSVKSKGQSFRTAAATSSSIRTWRPTANSRRRA